MTQEQLRMQMLAGIITEGQYKEKMEEVDSMGKIGNSYPTPGAETGKLRDKAWDLYDELHELFVDDKFYPISAGSDYVDMVIEDSIPEDRIQKIIANNTSFRGEGVGYILNSKLLTEEELIKIIHVLEGAIKLADEEPDETSPWDGVDIRKYGYDYNKKEWYKK
jgi:hypothetical protein